MLKPVEKPIKFIKNAATFGKTYPITHIEAVVDGNGKTLLDLLELMRNTIPSTSGDVMSYTDSKGNTHYIASTDDPSGIVGGGMTETTWQELKDKRDNGKLIPGALYRITDYQCTTTQENTQSAGHQFDIVLLALSENKLAEEGWAMMHDFKEEYTWNNTFLDEEEVSNIPIYLYKIVPQDYYGDCTIVDVQTGKGLTTIMNTLTIDEEAKTISGGEISILDIRNEGTDFSEGVNYFINSNLSAWKVWYCLDNDKSRFAWADDSITVDEPASIVHDRDGLVYERYSASDTTDSGTQYYAWKNGSTTIFTNTLTPGAMNAETYRISPLPEDDGAMITYDIVRSYTPAKSHPNGKGVIWRMIDEWNNDVGYDFKNIQFIRPMTDGYYDLEGDDTWVYTFSYVVDEVIQDGSLNQNIDNTINSIKQDNSYVLNNIVSIDNGYGHVSNSFINCRNVTIFNDVEYAQFINCYNFQIDDITNGTIFIKKKKVLTEE